jgi:hypothetical protein
MPPPKTFTGGALFLPSVGRCRNRSNSIAEVALGGGKRVCHREADPWFEAGLVGDLEEEQPAKAEAEDPILTTGSGVPAFFGLARASAIAPENVDGR